MTVIFVLILAAFMTWYCVRIRKDPSKSVMGGQSIDSLSVEANSAYAGQEFTWKHGLILLVFVAGIVYFAIGTKLWKYGPSEMAGILFVAAVFGNIVAGKSLDEGYKTFVKGGQTMVSTVLMIILASMISAILTNGLIIDTVVYYISLPLARPAQGHGSDRNVCSELSDQHSHPLRFRSGQRGDADHGAAVRRVGNHSSDRDSGLPVR